MNRVFLLKTVAEVFVKYKIFGGKSNMQHAENQINNNKLKTSALLILLLTCSLCLLLLDYTFQVPKHQYVQIFITIFLWILSFSVLFLFAHETMSLIVPKLELPKKSKKIILHVTVAIMALLLALQIIIGGNIPKSPYVSFLSSFPILCMVLLFDSVTLKNCAKGASIIGGWLILLSSIKIILDNNNVSILANKSLLENFFNSSDYNMLAISILIMTAFSNLISIYFAAKN